MVTVNSSLQVQMTTTDFYGLPSDPYTDEVPTGGTATEMNAVTEDGNVAFIFRGSFNPENVENDDPVVNYLTGYTEYATSDPSKTFALDGLPNYSLSQFQAINLQSWMSGFDVVTTGDTEDTIRGYGGGDAMNAGAGNDLLFGGTDFVDATDGADQMFGGRGRDTIYGNAGDDTIYGGNDPVDALDDADVIYGGAGADTIYGNAGNDIIDGNTGNDSLYGGLGDDSYAFNLTSGQDTIFQFEGAGTSGGDVIAISTSIYSNATQAMANMVNDGVNAYLQLDPGSGVLIINGADISADDFSFF